MTRAAYHEAFEDACALHYPGLVRRLTGRTVPDLTGTASTEQTVEQRSS